MLLLGALTSLRKLAQRWSPDAASAEDLLHDTLERGLRSLDRFEPGTSARAWLATIMYRLAIDSGRRLQRDRRMHARYRAELQADTSDQGATDAPDPAPPASDALRAMADLLVEPFRSTFVLRAFENLTYREISGRTGIPVSTVATRLMRARRTLRTRLTPSPSETGP
jgi:RNA polymerase sigma-70 factor (ECF subfamily)